MIRNNSAFFLYLCCIGEQYDVLVFITVCILGELDVIITFFPFYN